MLSKNEKVWKYRHLVVKLEEIYTTSLQKLRSECPIVSTCRSMDVLFYRKIRGLNKKMGLISQKTCILTVFFGFWGVP